jgi:hypothetical protein
MLTPNCFKMPNIKGDICIASKCFIKLMKRVASILFQDPKESQLSPAWPKVEQRGSPFSTGARGLGLPWST